MQTATTVLEAIGNCIISDLGRLESRMMRKYQVRFGGGLLEKGPRATSPVTYPAEFVG